MATFVSPGAYARSRPIVVIDDLEQLQGPSSGIVRLPVRLDWGPDPVYDVGDRTSLVWMYSYILAAALDADDLRQFINADHLRSVWHDLVLPARVRDLWEDRFPELAA